MTEEWTKAIRHRNTEALQDFYEKTYWWSLWTKQMSAYDMHLFNTQSSKRTFLEKIIGSWQSARVLVCVPPLSKLSKTKQTNDIISKENDTVISDKKQIAELFNTHFIQQIADRAPEISEVDHGQDYANHPSLLAIRERNTGGFCSFQHTNQVIVEKYKLLLDVRKIMWP